MPARRLSEDDFEDLCQSAKDWLASKPFKVDFKERIAAKINNLSSWDLGVSSNTISRYLKTKVEQDLPTEPDHEDVVDCITSLIVIIAMQPEGKIPAAFYSWKSPAHWDEILTVVSTLLQTNQVYSKWLERHLLQSAIAIPAEHLKRAQEIINEKDGNPRKKLKADTDLLKEQLRKKDARIVQLTQELGKAAAIADTSKLRTQIEKMEEAKAEIMIVNEFLRGQAARLEREKDISVATISQMQNRIEGLEKERNLIIANQPVGYGRDETAGMVTKLKTRLTEANKQVEQLQGDWERAIQDNSRLFAEKQKFEKEAQEWKTRHSEERMKFVLGDKSAYTVSRRRQE